MRTCGSRQTGEPSILKTCGPWNTWKQMIVGDWGPGNNTKWTRSITCISEILGRSEAFPDRIFYPCVLWARGLARLKHCRWAAAAVSVGVIWRFRLTFWPRNYIWSLSLWNRALVKALDALRPGFCAEFRYLSYGQSGWAWEAVFEEITRFQENELFQK